MSLLSATKAIGKDFILRDLSLFCDACNITHENIRNVGAIYEKREDCDVVQLKFIHNEDICQCLMEKLRICPYVILYSSKEMLN